MKFVRLTIQFILMSAALPLMAGIDQRELDLKNPSKPRLRWDNVNSAPIWIDGVSPQRNRSWKMDSVRLDSTDHVNVRIPRGSELRLLNPEQGLLATSLVISLSEEGELWVDHTPLREVDGKSLVIRPISDKPLLVHINPKSNQRDPIEFAIFIARRDDAQPNLDYQNPVRPDTTPVSVKRGIDLTAVDYWPLDAYTPSNIDIEGPARIQLQSHLIYPNTENRLLQDYRIQIRLDGRHAKWIESSTSAESAFPILVDGTPTLLGQRHTNYFDVPEGKHRLSIASDRSLLVRLLGLAKSDLLLPSLNYHPPASSTGFQDFAGHWGLSIWSPRNTELKQLVEQPGLAWIDRLFVAERLVRDNSLRDGGLVGSAYLLNSAMNQYDYPGVRRQAARLSGLRTSYRNLLPINRDDQIDHNPAYFLPRRIRPLSQPERQMVISEQHIEQWLSRIALGYFAAIPVGSRENAMVYRLRPRSASTMLRIAVNQQSPSENSSFWLQLDESAPVRLRLARSTAFRSLEFQSNPAEAALDYLRRRHELNDQPTLSGPFGALRQPAPLLAASTYELFVPAATQEVRIWQDDPSATNTQIALQYKAGKPFGVGEAAYLGLLKQVGRQTAYQYFYAGLIEKGGDNNLGQRVLENLWFRTLRQLKVLAQQYKASVPAYQLSKPNGLNQKKLSAKIESALAEQRRNNWAAALKIWSDVVHSSSGKDKESAQLHLAECLLQNGEVYLADRLWRYLSLSEDSEISLEAAEKLKHRYAASPNKFAAHSLAAAMFTHRPSNQALADLVDVFIDKGDYQTALLIALLLPKSLQKPEQLLLASYRLGWWRVFNQNISLVADRKRHFWMGLLQQRLGNYSAARTHWSKSGPDNMPWLNALDQGLALRTTKAQFIANHAGIDQFVDQWLAWDVPGPTEWRHDTFAVQRYSQAAILHNIDLDVFQHAVVATEEQPVAFKVIGPGQIRIKARPLHTPSNVGLLNGWVRLKVNGHKKWAPISSNSPATHVVLLDGERKPGKSITINAVLAAGLNEISIDGGSVPLAVQILRSQTRLPLSVFPRAGWATLRLGQPKRAVEQTANREYSVLHADGKKAQLVSFALLGDYSYPTEPIEISTSSGKNRGSVDDFFNMIERQQWKRLLTFDPNQDQETSLQQITAIAWLAENHPEKQKAAWFVAEHIARTYPTSGDIQTLWKRISRGSEWTNVTEVAEGSGLEFIKMQGWQPESPYLKKRKALLGKIANDEHIVAGRNQLVLAFLNAHTTETNLVLAQHRPDFIPSMPIVAVVQLDRGKQRRIVLNSTAKTKRIVLKIPTGEHRLRVSMQQPVAHNQFLGVRVTDSMRGSAGLVKEIERSFYKTRVSHPLRAHVMGPAWLRVEEWSAAGSTTRYQKVQPGWQIETIKPSNGRNETLVRLFVRRAINRPVDESLIEVVEPTITRSETIQIPDAPVTEHVRLKDAFELGAQEDGTLSVRSAMVRRNNVDEDNGGTQPEQFVQFDGTYLYKPEYRDIYSDSRLLLRIRENGNPSLGIKQRFDYLSDNGSWLPNFKLQSDLYFQIPDQRAEMSSLFRAGIGKKIPLTARTSLKPSLSVFARVLSLSDAEWSRLDANEKRRVDQDIFTPYKADHNYGQVLSLTLKHKPWLDTLWLLQSSVVSNEDLNLFKPDHTSLKVGWRQLLGPVVADISFRRKFFYRDDVRRRAAERSLANFRLDWDHWINEKNLIRIGMQYSRDIERSTDLGYFSLSWYPSEGRGYRDIRPGAIKFRNLMEPKIPNQLNNSLEDVGTHR